MEATIKKLNGETVAVSVEPSDSVETALRKISELHGISNLSLAFLEKEEAATAAAEPEAAPSKAAEEEVEEEEDDPLAMVEESEPAPAQPEGESDDWETAGKFKETANEAKASGDWAAAVDAYTSALMAQASALTHANRADCLLKLKRPVAAIADCDRALKINPDSAKALKIKGKALRFLSKWEEALASLTQAMSIDFDPDLQEMQTFVAGKVKYVKARQTQARLKEEAELRAKVKAQREEQRRQAAERASATARSSGGGAGAGAGAAGGFPGMGGGGFPGMGGGMPPGMADIFSDPELMAAMKNPKVMTALQGMMGGDPAAMAAAMQDPEVGPILMKLQQKMGGAMGGMGMGGMPGGGMPGGGMPGGGMPGGFDVDEGDDDLPDLDDVPDLD